MTKKLVAQIWAWSNACYKQALVDNHPGFFTEKEIESLEEREMKTKLYDAGKDFHSREINDSYLHYIIRLPVDQLELVLEAHNKGKIKRAPHTIDAITTELFERVADPESRQDYEHEKD